MRYEIVKAIAELNDIYEFLEDISELSSQKKVGRGIKP